MTRIYFNVGDKIKVDDSDYLIVGLIEFLSTIDNCRWIEYKLRSGVNSTSWLSIDNFNEEYSIFKTTSNRDLFSEEKLSIDRYKLVDSGNASVTKVISINDTDVGDTVKFREYEDTSEENIRSIEMWSDSTEYSTGYYLDANDISLIESRTHSYNSSTYSNSSSYSHSSDDSGSNIKFTKSGLVVLGIIAMIIIFSFFSSSSSNTYIDDYLSSNSNYTLATAITSDFKDDLKANVYTTESTVDSTTKDIIDAVEGDIESVTEEDGAVALLTDDEYCFVYTSDDNSTYIQISSREYTYSSSHSPYRSNSLSYLFYRDFYYSKGLNHDSNRYGNYTSYDSYDGSRKSYQNTSTYDDYSNTVRESSTFSRPSSGGGTSFGK